MKLTNNYSAFFGLLRAYTQSLWTPDIKYLPAKAFVVVGIASSGYARPMLGEINLRYSQLPKRSFRGHKCETKQLSDVCYPSLPLLHSLCP